MDKVLHLTVKPDWAEIERISLESIKFFKIHKFPVELIQSLNMILCELVENSLKYGDYTSTDFKVEVEIKIRGEIATIEVSNPFDNKIRSHLDRLDKTIQWIRGFQDPFEAYLEKLKEVSKKPLDDDESGLGLARITYEGQAIIDFFLGESDNITVSAVSNLGDVQGRKR